MILLSLAVLENARHGVEINQFDIAQTPVTAYRLADAEGPVVVIAHGFAGSQQMMQGYALPLAKAGYRVFVFEFLGHGRNPIPMSGDVTTVDGTTQRLVDQTNTVIDTLATDNRPFGLLGHSMATDVLVRVAANRADVGPVVLVSAFSQVIDDTTPKNLLLITGAWEPGLGDFALRTLQMVAPDASEGMTVTGGAVSRRAIAAPFSEHVSVLHSRVARREALAWFDRAYDRTSSVTILPTGWAILGLLAGLVLVFQRIASILPQQLVPQVSLGRGKIAVVLLAPALLAPLIAVPLNPAFLPVLVADYLGLHLLVFGTMQLALMRFWGVPFGHINWKGFALLLLWCVVFSLALDRYAANFWPTQGRLWIIGIMPIGAVPYMVADSVLAASGNLQRRLLLRSAFLASLAIAVILDFEGLFFLIMIAPVMILFYLVFGTMGRYVSRRVGPLSSGLALGVVLAWALGVSFPLFQA